MRTSASAAKLVRQIKDPRMWWALVLLIVMTLTVVIYRQTGDPSATVMALFVLFLCVRASSWGRRG